MARGGAGADPPKPRKGMPSPELDEAEFKNRYRVQFLDPAFGDLASAIDRISQVAWLAYRDGRKSPVTQQAGPGYADPSHELSVEWIAARKAILEAEGRHADKARPPSILVVNGSARSEHSCPGEMSKSFRLAEIARDCIETEAGLVVKMLDLSRLTSEFGRHIFPCKACFSTAPPLCHWPCSCYPNHSLGQTNDWMNEIYPLWVEAAGIMIVTPVNWYQVSSPVKLMMDRMVCADGGNPDPTLTQGKDAEEAKRIELNGWHYPRHLEGRLFAVVVHGDVEGAESVRRSLADWLRYMKLTAAGERAELDRYIGYWQPYATSHDELDRNAVVQEEVRNAARSLAKAVLARRAGRLERIGEGLRDPVSK